MDLASGIGNIRANRKAILFLGAGFSNDTVNLLGSPTPSARQLAKLILEHLRLPGEPLFSLAIDKLREKLKPAEAFDFVRDQLTVKDISDTQHEILTLPWTRIYTTNVDNIGSDHSRRRWLDATQDDQASSNGDFIYLHGCISNCTAANYYQRLKLGEQLYLQNNSSGNAHYHLLKQDLHECDVAIVIGYSMADPDFATTFFNSQDLINKCFVFSGIPDELSAHRISLIGTDTNMAAAEVMRLVRERKPDLENGYRSEIIVDTAGFTTKEITQSVRQNLLIFGRYSEDVARTSWSSKDENSYVIKRQLADRIAELSGPRIAILHSHLGNGKSLIFDYTRFLLTKDRKSTFVIKPETHTEALIECLKDIPPNSHVFFEGNAFAVADLAQVIQDRSLVFCATSRTTTIRVVLPALGREAQKLLLVLDANKLTNSELSDFHDHIDSMAFWPSELSDKNRQARISILANSYDANVSAIILKIFENEKIRKEISSQWQKAQVALKPIMDHFVVASYLQMFDVAVPPYLLNEFQSMDYRLLKDIENDIIRISSSGNIAFGNSIIGEFILGNHPKKNDIIGAVVRFVNFIDGHPSQRSWQWIVRRLLRYWNLSRLLASKTVPNEILDRASYVPSVNSDPLFWVQYSISQMENEDFLAADRFLLKAYTKANEKKGAFDTYQIDTHSARLVVRKIEIKGFYDGAAKDVLEATRKLRQVVRRRPDDTYHVSSVVCSILRAEIAWSYVLGKGFPGFKDDLNAIGNTLEGYTGASGLFAPERLALDLIKRNLN